MGVVCVLNYPVPEGKSGQQTVDLLQNRLEQLGAVKSGNFSVDCEPYHSQPSQQIPQRTAYLMHNSEQPASCFAILDTNTCLIADNLLGLLMIKIKDYYKQKKNNKVEAKGQRYELGDFIIKVGSVVLGQSTSFKGVLIEVEYCPCTSPSECWTLMKEFISGFGGTISENPTAHFTSKMDSTYGPSDTVMQYLEHFNNFRKATAPQQR